MDIKAFIDEYISFLKDNLNVKKIGDFHEITLPFYDRNNDALVIYVVQDDNGYLVSDDAHTIDNLVISGLNLSDKRKKTMEIICAKMGVVIHNNQLQIHASAKDLVNKVHTLAQAMLRIDDMYLTSQNRVSSYFIEDLMDFFDKNEIYYSRDVSFVGKSGVTHSFDFMFQRSKNNPERVCKAINNGTKNNMINVLFAWQDIESMRNNKSNLVVIINDNNKIEPEVIKGFDSYNVQSYLWSELPRNVASFS